MADEPDEQFDDEAVEEPDDLDDADLETLDDDDTGEDDLVDDDLVDAVPLAEVDLDDDDTEPKPAPAVATDDDEDEDDDDEVLDPDDVEASLDVILKDRLVVEEEDEEEEEDEVPDVEERAEGAPKVPAKRPDEFVCQSCFLVKHPSQLEDPQRMYCRDCV